MSSAVSYDQRTEHAEPSQPRLRVVSLIFGSFYRDVTGVIHEMADEVRSRVSHNDVVQLEVIGETVRNHVCHGR